MLSSDKKPLWFRLTVFFIALTFFLELWAPATSGSTLSSAGFKAVIRIVYFLLALILVALTLYRYKFNIRRITILAVTPLIDYLFTQHWYLEAPGGSLSTLLLCVIIALEDQEVLSAVYICIYRIMVIISILGIICYISNLFDLPLPHETIDYYSVGPGQYYINYYFSYLHSDPNQTRLCGLFNEPGWFGTFLAFTLCKEQFDLSKKMNIVLLFAGILTWSLAFFIILAFYVLLYSLKDRKKMLLVFSLLVFYMFIMPKIHTGNQNIDFLLGRLTIHDGELQGNSRSSMQFDAVFNNVIKSKDWAFGRKLGYSVSTGTNRLSIKQHIIDFGIMGTFIIFFPTLFYLFVKNIRTYQIIVFVMCVAISLYQRPWLFEVSNYILLLVYVASLREENIQKKSIKIEEAVL